MHFQIILCSVAAFSLVQANPFVFDLPGLLSSDNNHIIKSKRNAEIEDALDKEVFKIPRDLKANDEINVTGLMEKNYTVLTVSLMAANEEGKPDHLNVACQVRLDFPSVTSSKDTITIITTVDGKRKEVKEKEPATDMFMDSTFSIQFIVKSENIIGVNLKGSSTDQDCKTELGLKAVQYITVGGDVDKVQQLGFILG